MLAQAFLLARVAARAFGGSSLDDVAPALVLLGLVVVARAAGAWGFEVAGRRAAAEVVSQLRLDVVDARLRRRPAALDGTQTSEVTTAAVTGVDALEATFARYLPQIVLAAVVPIAVLAIVVSIDPLAAGVMVLTLPLVPVFMWLVGRQTARKARERWQALALLSNHFLDVVRGLPTLRAFNRGAVQAERIASVSDEYRRTTMGTLRLAFLSGAILELAATLGIALVAVVVGVRLAEGNIGFEAALTVLVLAPELYLPLRNLAAQWHASADGAAVAERLLDLSEAPAVAVESVRLPSAALAPIAFERVSYRYPTRELDVLRDVELVHRAGRDRCARRAERRGEVHAAVAPHALRRAVVRPDSRRRRRPRRASIRRRGAASRRTCRSSRRSSGGPSRDNIRLGAPAAAGEEVRAAAALARARRVRPRASRRIRDGGRRRRTCALGG